MRVNLHMPVRRRRAVLASNPIKDQPSELIADDDEGGFSTKRWLLLPLVARFRCENCGAAV